MDWLTILLVFLFFVLPLIQEVAKKRRDPPGPVEPHDYGEEEWEEEEEPSGAGTGERRDEGSAWESLGLEGIFTEGPAPTPRPAPPTEPAPPPAPEPVPVPHAPPPRVERPQPVPARNGEEEDPALERLRAYERRVRDATRRPVPDAPPVPGFTRTARSARMAGEISDLGEVQRRGSTRARRLRALLDDPQAFEDAFVLREVLGPPRGIEPHA